ncbi:hypothetical protein [Actinoplanes italicus]|uniref:Uncharacterized protein n=1 Tax=Actinoplanes italicus TaxID=113567 RepID=A0A2T0JX53_9ACTN|nr:hypothetical protein [Actinoplanes italicus]PRX12587.1 hypothetical protein CLV67_12710 [Actinoplanes italicus]
MIVLVTLMMTLFGGTTWLVLQRPLASNPELHDRLTSAAFLLSLAVVAAVLHAALTTSP